MVDVGKLSITELLDSIEDDGKKVEALFNRALENVGAENVTDDNYGVFSREVIRLQHEVQNGKS